MCPIFSSICRMKLNEGHFSLGTVIIHFGNKPYQETHFKSHLNSVLLCKKFDFESHWNALMIFDKKDMTSDFNVSHGKMPDFVSFPLFGSL